MAKKTYIGVNGVAKKVKKGYVGVNNLAKKIKKAYIGVGDIARPCWSDSGQLSYYGTITTLSDAKTDLSSGSNDNYALFIGGYYRYYSFGGSGDYSFKVDAYSQSLTKSTLQNYPVQNSLIPSSSIGDYIVFGGGLGSAYTCLNLVVAYSNTLTRQQPSGLYGGGYLNTATKIGDYILFGGGAEDSGYQPIDGVTPYNKSLVRGTKLTLNTVASGAGAGSNKNYAIFAGGATEYSEPFDEVYATTNKATAFSKTLVKSTPTSLTKNVWGAYGVSAGQYVLISTGSTVDVYDSNLLKKTPIPLSTSFSNATTLGDFAIFAGNVSNNYATVIDSSLVKQESKYSGVKREGVTATTLGNYAIFGGGLTKSSGYSLSNTVDVYKLVQ